MARCRCSALAAPAYGSATALAAICGILLVALPGTGARATAVAQPSMARSQLVTSPNEPTTDHHTVVNQNFPVVGAK